MAAAAEASRHANGCGQYPCGPESSSPSPLGRAARYRNGGLGSQRSFRFGPPVGSTTTRPSKTRIHPSIQLGEAGGAIAQRSISTYNLFRRTPSGQLEGRLPERKEGQSEMARLLAARRGTKPCYIVDPRRSNVMTLWDASTTFCLLFTALVTPYEVAFLRMSTDWQAAWHSPLFVCNRMIDLVFTADMCLQFVLMYQDTNRLDGVKWIDEPKAIVRNYVRGWFAFDLFSILPSTFDLIPFLLDNGASTSTGDVDVLKRFKFLRVIRCLRLVKLVRLLRASRMMARWETRVSLNYGHLSLWKMFCLYLLIAHWSGCLLVLPTTFYDNLAETWLGHYGYCIAFSTASPSADDAVNLVNATNHGDWSEAGDDLCYRTFNLQRGLLANPTLIQRLLDDGTCAVRCETPARLFAASVYFALQMICGATGGELQRGSFNTQEQVLFALLTVIGALLWGQVIGTFVSVIANASPDLAWFRSTMDQLNSFMSLHGLPHEMRIRLREYVQQSRHVQRGLQRRRILKLMSPMLQGEVALAINHRWLEQIRFLRGAERELIILVACSLQPAVFVPGELTTPGYLYVIHKGVALYGGRLLTSGKCWGQDMILARQHLCHFSARAMSYLEVYRLSRAELLEMARPFPIALRRIRWEALRLAIIRALITHTPRSLRELTFSSQLDSFLPDHSPQLTHRPKSSRPSRPNPHYVYQVLSSPPREGCSRSSHRRRLQSSRPLQQRQALRHMLRRRWRRRRRRPRARACGIILWSELRLHPQEPSVHRSRTEAKRPPPRRTSTRHPSTQVQWRRSRPSERYAPP